MAKDEPDPLMELAQESVVKTEMLRLRISLREREMLEVLAQDLGVTRSAAVRALIQLAYKERIDKKKKGKRR